MPDAAPPTPTPPPSLPRRLVTALRRWVDSGAGGPVDPQAADRVDWPRILPFVVLHLGCLGVLWVGWSPVAVGVALGLYLLRMFAITGFYHRYFSHRSFKTSRAAQFVFAVLGNSAVQRGPLWWAAHHRKHHRHSDEAKDVHSPHVHGFWWSHMGWITNRANFATDFVQVPDFMRYRELRWLDRFNVVVPVLLAVGLYVTGEWLGPAWGTSGMQLLVWGFFLSTTVLFHATCSINSVAHVIGKRRYDTRDHSRNNWWLALLTLGEGWHNNHHRYPAAVRQGHRWYEIDFTSYGLALLARLGVIWDRKSLPRHVLEGRVKP
ncbi:MAG: acyl-CoA desaturase [Planctomycetota bacterium]|nr:acyl-CoA desaturase [Planctomycetota bacterium]